MNWLHKFFKVFTLAILLNLGLGVAPSFADAVTYLESYTNNINGVAGLSGISDVAVSPDGKFVYTASYQASAVSVFERNPDTGQLTYRSTKTGLSAAFSVDVSADNKSVYVASPTGSVVIAFSRDLTTGELTETNRLGGSPTGGFVSVSTSPDAKTVYGIGGSPSGLVVFNRDASTGAITRVADYADNVNGNALGQIFSPTGSPIKNIASSADGNFVYVTSTTDNAVSLFSRDTTTSALTLLSVYTDNVASVDGLQAASSAKLSPDGKHLYVTGQGESSVAIFSVNSTSGELTYLAKVTHGVDGVTNMQGARSLTISPDGKYVLVSAINSSSLTAFLRDSTTGLLSFNSQVVNSVNGVTNFSAPSGMSTDPLNRHLYVAAQNSASLVVFSLPTPAVRLSVDSQTATVSGPAVVLDTQLTVLDSDSPDLVSAQVSISSGFIATDTLAVQTVAGISASYDASTGVLSLSGVASLADYQSVLRSLTYQAGADPTLNSGDTSQRTISFMVSDGDNSSAVSSIVVTVEKSDLFTVNFIDWDNTVLSTQQVAAGSAAVAPTSPTRTGYAFTGWSIPFDNISSALTVQAQYSINNYTITFESAGGTAVAPIIANFGAAVTAPANPVRAGYTFVGWNPAVPSTMPASDTTVTAQWAAAAYTITFDSAGGSAVAPISANFGATITAPAAPTREGYTFVGWNPAVPSTMPATNSTVTAQWTANSYTITFDTAGGSSVAPISADFGAAINAPAAPTREGYSFAGWTPALPAVMPATNSTVTAQWTADSYTITFNSAGGSAVAPISANFGAAITAPAAPTREGYTFAGWTPAVPSTMPATNSTVTAQWTINSYTITFDTAGGSAVAPISADFGAAITAPAAPTREGYSFVGWSPAVPSTMPATNSTVTAQWTINSYTITFDTAGGSAVAPISADFGAAITAPATPTREGYTFVGWSPAVPSTMPATNSTVTAQWTVAAYTITFDTAGGSAVAPISADFGAAITAPAAPTREGYSFAGWSPAVPSTMPATNSNVTAQWTVAAYTITFDTAGGSAVAPVSANFGAAITAPAAPTREGYTFVGWSPAVPSTMPATNSTVTAQWTANSYTITFDSAGGSAVAPISANFGAAITAPAAPTREGYTFVGWSPAVPSTMPATNSTVTAQWTANSYTITFDSAGGSAVAPISANFGAAITAPAAPTREGYTFVGWSPAVPSTMPATNSTVTAQWTANSYTITFDSAGGSAVAPISANFGAAISAPAAPTREGYTFVGWSPAVPTVMPATNLTVTAQWTAKQYQVIAQLTGEGTISPAAQQVEHGKTATFDLTLMEEDAIVNIGGSCGAARSGNDVVTAAITTNCDVQISVYPSSNIEGDISTPVSSGSVVEFAIIGGAGEKALIAATVIRADIKAELVLAEVEALLHITEDGKYQFIAERTGQYALTFQDVVSGEHIAVELAVLPYLAFAGAAQPVAAGSTATVRIWLSDEPAYYPVTVRLSGDGAEAKTISLTATDLRQQQYLTVVSAEATLSLDEVQNALAGTPAQHQLQLQNEPVALALQPMASQQGKETVVISQDNGDVTVSVTVLNGVAETFSWSSESLDIATEGDVLVFTPENMTIGVHDISVTASNNDGQEGSYVLTLQFISHCVQDNCYTKTGLPESANPFINKPQRLPICPTGDNVRSESCQVATQSGYIEVGDLYQLTLGEWSLAESWASMQFGAAVGDDLADDTAYTRAGPVVNFDIRALAVPGESVPIVIALPQGQQIPENAVWRKFIKDQWQDFVIDGANHIDSAAAALNGSCPAVSSDVWQQGLIVGHGCIRLTIKDGGPNDNDAKSNGVIRDPGVLAVLNAVEPEPEVPGKDVKVRSGGTLGAMFAGLLAVLVTWRRRTATAALLLPCVASANGFYVGADAMAVRTDVKQAEVSAAAKVSNPDSTTTIDNKQRSGMRWYGGYALSTKWSVELAWLDLGSVNTAFSNLAAQSELSTLNTVIPLSGKGVEASVVWQPWVLNDRITPALRVGLWHMDTRNTFDIDETRYRFNNNDNVLVVELYTGIVLTEQWRLKAGISHYDTTPYRTYTAQIGLQYQF